MPDKSFLKTTPITSPMKLNPISPQVIAAVCALPAIMAFCPTLSAQEAMPGTGAEQGVTFAFTETYTDYYLRERDYDTGNVIKDGEFVYENEWYTEKYNSNDDLIEESDNYEYGAKQVTVKISNKEFLVALKDEGYISDPAGWAVKFVTPGDDPGSEYGRFYAVKTGFEPIDLSEIISTESSGYADTETEKWSNKTTYKYANDDYTETTTQTWSFSSKWMTNLFIEFSFTDSYLFLDGIFNESWSVKSFGKGEEQYWQFVPGAAKFDSGAGSLYYEEEYEYEGEWYSEYADPSVLKGTISLSAGKLFPDIYVPYPDFEPNYDDDDDEEL